jgi:hypothetical protein
LGIGKITERFFRGRIERLVLFEMKYLSVYLVRAFTVNDKMKRMMFAAEYTQNVLEAIEIAKTDRCYAQFG